MVPEQEGRRLHPDKRLRVATETRRRRALIPDQAGIEMMSSNSA